MRTELSGAMPTFAMPNGSAVQPGRQFLQRLQPVFHRTETNDHLTPLAAGVELAHGQHRLAIGLLVEGDRHAETVGIVRFAVSVLRC
jgi:hypothetical protein